MKSRQLVLVLATLIALVAMSSLVISLHPAKAQSQNCLFIDSGQNLGQWESLAIALADIDGDGDLDAFVACGSLERAEPNRVLLNDGTGMFSDSGQLLGNFETNDVAMGDIDGDGDIDAVTGTNTYFDNKVWINDGTGAYTDSGQSLGTYWAHLALGDLDGDGDLDVYVVNGAPGGIPNELWFNDGTGTFINSGQSMGNSWSTCVALGDINNDGDLDAFVTNSGSNNKIWLNDGNGIFTDSGQGLGNGAGFNTDLGDLDGDGDLDVFVTYSHNQPGEVWLNDGTGVFANSGQALGGAHNSTVKIGDLDRDGDLDVFMIYHAKTSQVWLNDGTGVFTDSGQAPGGNTYKQDLALGDVDSDGDLDALVVSRWDDPNKVWLLECSGMVISCDASGSERYTFSPGEGVYCKADGLEADTSYRIWIQDDPIDEGSLLDVCEDPSGIQELATSDGSGYLAPVLIWTIPSYAAPTSHQFDIVVDKQGDGANTGRYNPISDGLDSSSVVGFSAPVPEIASVTLLELGILALCGFIWLKRRHPTTVALD